MATRQTGPKGFNRTSALLQPSIRRASESRGFAQTRLLTHWPEIAGESVAAIARPVDISYGRHGMGATLTLLTTGAQAPILEMQKESLREKINAVYGYNAIVRIRLTQTAPSGFAEGQADFTHRRKAQTVPPARRAGKAGAERIDQIEEGQTMTLMKHLFAAGALALATLAAPVAAQEDAITEMTMGPEDAKVTIIEYASFTCPHCASFHNGPLKELKAEYIDTGKIHFVYRDVYFDRFGLWASMVARCGGPDKFFGIADMLYAQQRDWAQGEPAAIADSLRRIGKLAGIEPDALEACLNDRDKAQALVAWYQENATAHDVNSTPTLIINEKTYGNMAYADLKAIIDEKLAQ
jgi:protein-disulfide isomerase